MIYPEHFIFIGKHILFRKSSCQPLLPPFSPLSHLICVLSFPASHRVRVPLQGLQYVCFSSVAWSFPGCLLPQITAEVPSLQGTVSYQPGHSVCYFQPRKYLTCCLQAEAVVSLWVDRGLSAPVSAFLSISPSPPNLFAVLGMESRALNTGALP